MLLLLVHPAATIGAIAPLSTRYIITCAEFRCRWPADLGAHQLRQVFSNIKTTGEMFSFRGFTRLEQLKHLIATEQIDTVFFLAPARTMAWRGINKMLFTSAQLEGAPLIDIEPRKDERGFFARTWCRHKPAARGLDTEVAQESISLAILYCLTERISRRGGAAKNSRSSLRRS